MNVRSLGYRTDLLFPRFGGEVIDRGEYLVIRTAQNPTFHWGNFLLFPEPPTAEDYPRWRALFAQEIGPHPLVEHITFGVDTIDGTSGDIQPFLDAGFDLVSTLVLTATQVEQPSRANQEVIVRPLTTDAEWEDALRLEIRCFRGEHNEPGYSIFARRLQAAKRAMVNAGIGLWFGAFLDNRLVAELGLFADGDVGRYQTVCTDPEYTRRGICSRLVYETARFGLTKMGIRTLVMAADPEYHAAQIYESVGFRRSEIQIGIGWWDRALEARAASTE